METWAYALFGTCGGMLLIGIIYLVYAKVIAPKKKTNNMQLANKSSEIKSKYEVGRDSIKSKFEVGRDADEENKTKEIHEEDQIKQNIKEKAQSKVNMEHSRDEVKNQTNIS
jgi:hypothetical protein